MKITSEDKRAISEIGGTFRDWFCTACGNQVEIFFENKDIELVNEEQFCSLCGEILKLKTPLKLLKD
ncbi:MAG: hypothetical protein FVQ80_13960 [Planctomycetes bacterium]|nr:hypothetical protein [Planctomycetota bacterium]